MRILLLLLLMLLVPAAAEAQIRLPSIKHGLIELALSQVSSPGSFEITAGAIEELESGVTSLVDVKVADNEGVWLTLERVSFSWEPSAILSGELKITRLELIGLTVSRPPSSEAEPPELKPVEPSGRGLFDWPRAPIDLSVEGVRLERVSIAEGVLAQAITFDAEGRAFDMGDLQELALSVTRTDQIAGRIEMAMRRDFAANTLTLKLEAEEAAGGIVAASAGFPMDAPARLRLNAEGPPEDWQLVFDAGVERVFDAGGNARLAYADRLSVTADFSVTPGPELDETLRTVLGEKAVLAAQVEEREDGRIEVIRGALASPALKLEASGAFATGAGESDLAVSLEALAPLAALAEGVEFERFSFEGRVTGPQGGLAAKGAVGLTGLKTAAADAAALRLDGSVTQTAGGARFSLDGLGQGLRIDQMGPEVIGEARLGVGGELDGDLLTLERASLDGAVLTAEVSGRYDLAASAGQFGLRLALPELAPVAAAYGLEARGRLEGGAELALAGEAVEATTRLELTGFALAPVAAGRMTLGGQVRVDPEGIGFDLAGDGQGLTLDQVPPELTRKALTYALRGKLREDVLALEQLRLDSPLAKAEASGRVALEAGEAALDYRLSAADLGPVARAYGAALDGALEAEGRAEGPFEALRLAGRAAIAGARFEGRSYGDLEIEHAVTLAPALEGDLGLAMRGGAFGDGSAAARFRLDGTRLALPRLEARLLGIAAAGQAEVDLETALAEGTFDIARSDLAAAARFAGLELTGSAAGRVTLSAPEGRQDLAAELSLSGVGTGGIAAEGAKLRASVTDLTGAIGLDVRVEATGVAAEPLQLARLEATARGPLDGLEFDAAGEGTLGADPLKLSLAGRAAIGGATTDITLARAEVTSGPVSLRLRRALEISVAEVTVSAEGLDLALPGDGALTGRAALHGDGFAGDLALARLPLDVVARWTEAPVAAGTLDLNAKFDTRPGTARANLTLRGWGISFEKTSSASGSLGLDLDGSWDGRRAEARAEVRGDFGDPLRARLGLPLRPGPGGVPEVPPRGELDGSLTWTGDIGKLWAMVPAVGHILDGHTEIDLALSGRMDAPVISGKAEIRDGQYQNLDTGTILTGVTVTTDIGADSTVRVAVKGSDGAKGTVTVDLALDLSGGTPRMDMKAVSDRAVLVRRDAVTAKISGDVAMAGPLNDLALTGALKIEKAEVRLIAAAPPEVVTLDGIRIKGAPEDDGNGDGESRVSLDVTVTAPRDIFVRGRGLDSEWKLDLAVTGDAASPVVTGEIERLRGRLELLGRPFELARGRVTFDGGAEIDPLVDVSLEREANGIRGGIVIEGRASNPELRFASVPELPEDEVLPRLLFGQSKQSLTGTQALQLATGVATLLSGKAGPLDFAREAVGVDVLRIEGETPEDASVTVGRNIGEGIFVGARQGLQGQGTTVTVEVDVFDGVKVDSELKQDGGSNVGVIWRKDF